MLRFGSLQRALERSVSLLVRTAAISCVFTCFVSGVPTVVISCSSPAADQILGLLSHGVTYLVVTTLYQQFHQASCGPWTGAHRVHIFFFSSHQGKMTLKSNKNEPAVILEPVSSVRTALSDLYLEQLLQNKPKSDKVGVSF